jgi:serine/threonine protein kinase
MDEAGIRPSRRARTVGDYALASVIFNGPKYQDWEAQHVSLPRLVKRIRIYPVAKAATAEEREALIRAARREAQVLIGVQHPGIVRTEDFREHELGPALVFDYEPKSMRLDHFLAEHGHRLDADLRLGLLRQIAEAIQHAHRKKLVHRALSPQSLLVLDPESPRPSTRVSTTPRRCCAPGGARSSAWTVRASPPTTRTSGTSMPPSRAPRPTPSSRPSASPRAR